MNTSNVKTLDNVMLLISSVSVRMHVRRILQWLTLTAATALHLLLLMLVPSPDFHQQGKRLQILVNLIHSATNAQSTAMPAAQAPPAFTRPQPNLVAQPAKSLSYSPAPTDHYASLEHGDADLIAATASSTEIALSPIPRQPPVNAEVGGQQPVAKYPEIASISSSPANASPLPEQIDPPVDSAQLLSSYSRGVKNQVLAHKAYPRLAERLGHEGTVKVRFTLEANGNLASVIVAATSGYDELDQAAVEAVQSAGPYDKFPAGMIQQEIVLSLTLHFHLD